MWYTHTMVLLNHWKEWNDVICSNIDGSRECHTEWSKSDRKRKLSYEIPYMWNLKRNTTRRRKDGNELSYKTKLTDLENKFVVSDYTVEVRNRFKALDLIECVMNYGWKFMTLYKRHGSRPSQEKGMQKSKMAVWGGLPNSCEKNRSEKQRRKVKIYPFECRVPKNSKEKWESLPQ